MGDGLGIADREYYLLPLAALQPMLGAPMARPCLSLTAPRPPRQAAVVLLHHRPVFRRDLA
jgi:hypothetical protein